MPHFGWRLSLEGLVGLAIVVASLWVIRALPFNLGPSAQPWSALTVDGALRLSGELYPAAVGVNTLDFTLSDAAGQMLSGVSASVQFLPVGGGGVVAQRALTETGAGRYRASGLALTRLGPWQALITLEHEGVTTYATLDWRGDADGVFRPAGESLPWTAQALGWLNRQGALVLSGAALAVMAVWSWRAQRALPRQSRGWVLALVFLLGAGYLAALRWSG
jgi:hypothetical protein